MNIKIVLIIGVTGGEDVADPSLGRVGIYIEESSRSLAERTSEHFCDAEGSRQKNKTVKLRNVSQQGRGVKTKSAFFPTCGWD